RHSDTFAHGFLVFPICLFLVWRSRDTIAPLAPQPFPIALVLLLPLGLAWLVGRAASTLQIEQFAFVAMIPVLVLAHFGPRVARRMAFPLAFLFFAVPFGDIFQPTLMAITAEFAEAALRLSGIAVAREGLYLATTTSRWHVVESCSGLRFTIAGVVLATLFAHLSYRSNLKRAIFVASAVVVSIFANGIRAYVLILVGHMTDMRLGGGLDHYAYGWLVFTLTMAGFFMGGAAFRDRDAGGVAPPAPDRSEPPAARGRLLAVASLAAALAVAWPLLDAWAASRAARAAVGAIAAPGSTGSWVLDDESATLWKPFFHHAASESNRRYLAPDGSVQCYIAYYANQSQGREMLHDGNGIIDIEDLTWRIVREGGRTVSQGSSRFTARETVFRVPEGEMVVWHWYWIPDENTSDPIRAKWLQARARLLGRPDRAAVVVLAATAPASRDAAALLERFSGDMLPEIHQALRGASHAR
ncbi:MAG TPA: exosortase A, partial [Candidatus Eisenbacteria bacterium]|nr:exosortase A [Candidatus Eisenbacteria bacterium]